MIEEHPLTGELIDEYPDNRLVAVDRREETLVRRRPGYEATEQVIHDIAAERRMRLYQMNRILWSSLVFLEFLLGLRFLLKLLAANPDSGFGVLLYGLSGLFLGGFNGLLFTPVFGDSIVEFSTLVAMVVYALAFWGIEHIVRIAVDRPRARSLVITTRQQTPGRDGNVYTTHTTISDGRL